MTVLCIIQARMGSERLPGKVMKLLGNKPMIEHTLERVKTAKSIDKVVLATSNKPSENVMVDYLTKKSWSVFLGEENNVLKRYVECEEMYHGDIIVRITGDCPFIDPDIIDNVISYFKMNDFDYVRLDVPNSFIRGFDIEVFSKEAMRRTYEITRSLGDNSPYKEHVTLYMYKHPDEFKIGYVYGNDKYNKNYRLCVDTQADFDLVSQIYNNFNDDYISSKEIVSFLDNNPDIASINQDVVQKTN